MNIMKKALISFFVLITCAAALFAGSAPKQPTGGYFAFVYMKGSALLHKQPVGVNVFLLNIKDNSVCQTKTEKVLADGGGIGPFDEYFFTTLEKKCGEDFASVAFMSPAKKINYKRLDPSKADLSSIEKLLEESYKETGVSYKIDGKSVHYFTLNKIPYVYYHIVGTESGWLSWELQRVEKNKLETVLSDSTFAM